MIDDGCRLETLVGQVKFAPRSSSIADRPHARFIPFRIGSL